MKTMTQDQLFLVTPPSIKLINEFLKKGQLKVHQEFNLSLRALDTSKSINIGSIETRQNSQVELRSRPPNLIPVTLNLSLDNQFITLHIHLSSDELLTYTIDPPPGLRLHHHRITVTKYNRLEN